MTHPVGFARQVLCDCAVYSKLQANYSMSAAKYSFPYMHRTSILGLAKQVLYDISVSTTLHYWDLQGKCCAQSNAVLPHAYQSSIEHRVLAKQLLTSKLQYRDNGNRKETFRK
ncbi:hypothetical protein Ddc_16411 [Ditylenchus destructor]|nr:hypothetical protein Ddc_16411 [Ditylenchus destructor]